LKRNSGEEEGQLLFDELPFCFCGFCSGLAGGDFTEVSGTA
jgi:hypothetical protein